MFSKVKTNGKHSKTFEITDHHADVKFLKRFMDIKHDYNVECTTRSEFLKDYNQKFRERLQRGKEQEKFQLSTYVTEIYGCLYRVTTSLHSFYDYCTLLPQNLNNNEDKFISTS